ncbi:MAG TPA: DnaB-like helicase C-terminal domain-containing protein [Polyangiaceae bacterium]|nr:DnaB-like helicase C-terminal domain-containing protein [Polyangiaceae bacterium]
MSKWTAAFKAEAPRQPAGARPVVVARTGNGKATRAESYVRAALEREVAAVAAAQDGERHNLLNKAIYSVAGYIHTGHVSEQEIRSSFMAAGRACRLPDEHITETLDYAIEAGKEEPRDVPETELPADDDQHVARSHVEGDAKQEHGTSIVDVLNRWRTDGSLIHEPTGIRQLDDLTGGGPVYGTRWYIAGAPDGWKTGFLAQLGHNWALRGIEIGALAVDEEDSDLVTRLAQRCGYDRIDCEIRDPATLATMVENFGSLPIRFYTGTIEAAAKATAERAAAAGTRGALLLDSIQTVTCEAAELALLSGRELSEVQRVTLNTRAHRAVTSKYKLIGIATSEMGRGAYSSSDPEKQTPTMAAGKWSGAIEYSARVLLGVRCVADESDMIELEIAKNKHGPSGKRMYLRTDRRSQTIIETNYTPEPSVKHEERDASAVRRTYSDAAIVARCLHTKPGMGIRDLRAAARAAAGIGQERVDSGVAALGDAVVVGSGPRNSKPMTLLPERVPATIRELMEATK